MANGFLTTSPASRHATDEPGIAAGWVWGQRFNCPGSGTQEISEIGCYLKDNGNQMRFAIFTDDSGNECPEVMVANSESATLTTEAAFTKQNHIYSTKPELTGGVDYWLIMFFDGAINFDANTSASGIVGLSKSGETAYTWPTGADWHSHSDRTGVDMGIYAVYEAAAGGISIPVVMHHLTKNIGA